MGLIGPNGAGKTTFMNAVSGFVPLTAGTVTMEGQTSASCRPQKLVRLGLVRTFQDVATFPELTVFENIELGALGAGLSRKRARERAWELIDEPRPTTRRAPAGVGASARRGAPGRRRPRRRRPAASSCCSTSRPPASTTPESLALTESIAQLREQLGCGVLLVEHDMRIIFRVCERIQVLDYGKSIAVGSPEEIRTNRAVIAAYLGREGSAGCCGSLTSPSTTAGSPPSTSSRSRSTRASSSGSSGTTAPASPRRCGRSPAC